MVTSYHVQYQFLRDDIHASPAREQRLLRHTEVGPWQSHSDDTHLVIIAAIAANTLHYIRL